MRVAQVKNTWRAGASGERAAQPIGRVRHEW
jgi:hypothetical protein